MKHNRAYPTTRLVTAIHSAAQETPVPTHVVMILHAHTRKRELVDKLSHLGMSISYTRVIDLSAQMENSACKQFQREQVMCSPKMRSNVFTTSAISTTIPVQRQRKCPSMVQLSPSSSTPVSLAKEWTESLQSLVDLDRQARKWSAAYHTTILMCPQSQPT